MRGIEWGSNEGRVGQRYTRTNDTVDKLITRNSGTPTLVSRCFDNYFAYFHEITSSRFLETVHALSLALHSRPPFSLSFLIKPSFPCRNLRLKNRYNDRRGTILWLYRLNIIPKVFLYLNFVLECCRFYDKKRRIYYTIQFVLLLEFLRIRVKFERRRIRRRIFKYSKTISIYLERKKKITRNMANNCFNNCDYYILLIAKIKLLRNSNWKKE